MGRSRTDRIRDTVLLMSALRLWARRGGAPGRRDGELPTEALADSQPGTGVRRGPRRAGAEARAGRSPVVVLRRAVRRGVPGVDPACSRIPRRTCTDCAQARRACAAR